MPSQETELCRHSDPESGIVSPVAFNFRFPRIQSRGKLGQNIPRPVQHGSNNQAKPEAHSPPPSPGPPPCENH